MELEQLKTHYQMLQEIIQEDFYSVLDFLLYSTEENRKETEKKLTDLDYKQYYEYLDSFTFENRDELEAAICKYCEYVNQRDLGIGEMWDVSEMAYDYIKERWLPFDD